MERELSGQSEIASILFHGDARRERKTVAVGAIRLDSMSQLCSDPAAYRSRQRLTSFQWLINELNSFNLLWSGWRVVAIVVVVVVASSFCVREHKFRTKRMELLNNTSSCRRPTHQRQQNHTTNDASQTRAINSSRTNYSTIRIHLMPSWHHINAVIALHKYCHMLNASIS